MSKVTIPNSETGFYEEKDLSNAMTRKEKEDSYVDFFNRYTNRIQKIESNLLEKEKEEIKSSNRNIEILAIFVALFTFISIDAQILKTEITFYTAIGFSLIMLGALLLFILVLYIFIDINSSQTKVKVLFGILFMICLIITGIAMATIDHIGYTKKVNELNNKASLTSDEFNNFKKCLKDGGWNKCF